MTDKWTVDAILSLMGGTIFHFIVGIKMMWGNIAPYVTSYLVQFDPTVTQHSALHIYTGIFLGQSLTMYLGGRLEKSVGPRPSAYVGAAIVSGCTYLSSNCTTLRSLAFLQALVGAGIGLSYSAPILCGFGHLGGDNRGIVSGIVTTGSGVGPFLAGLVATTFVNGENYPVDAATGLYDPSSSPVVGRVPDMFRVLGTMYAVVGFFGATLLIPSGADGGARDEDGNDGGAGGGSGEGATLLTDGVGFDLYHDRSATREDDGCGKEESATTKRSTVKSILRSSNETRTRGHQRYGSRVKIEVRFELTTTQMINDSLSWLVVSATICTGVSGFYLAATYKSYGQTYISDDHFLTVIGCLGCLCNGASRAVWGMTADRIGHFETLEVTAYAYPIVMLVYTLSVQSRLAFGLCVCSMYGLWGASGCLMPAIVAFLFGDKHLGTNYGFIFLVYGVMCVIIIDTAGNSGFDFGRLNYLFIAVSFVGAILCSHIRYLTSKVKDEKALRHHRSTSSVHSMM